MSLIITPTTSYQPIIRRHISRIRQEELNPQTGDDDTTDFSGGFTFCVWKAIRLGRIYLDGYNPTRYIPMINKYGPIEAVKKTVMAGSIRDPAPFNWIIKRPRSGFTRMQNTQLHLWSNEGLVLKFPELFLPNWECYRRSYIRVHGAEPPHP
jgi:hypothetical protein